MNARRLARLLLGLWFAVAVGSVLFAWTNRPFSLDLRSLDSSDLAYVAASAVYTLVFAAVGTLVASRTRNPIGFLLLAVALGWQLPLLFEQYAIHAVVVTPGSLPAARWVMWVASNWTFALLIPPLLLVFLLFPTGRPRSARWRPLVAAAPSVGLLLAVSGALRAGPIAGNLPSPLLVTNPTGLEGVGALLDGATTVGAVASVIIGFAGIACLVLRFRDSHGSERQQIKWLVFVALAAVLVLGVLTAVGTAVTDPTLNDAVDSIGWGVLVTTVMLGMPLAIGAAVLRHRLYDVDRVISRTVSYALVTGVLVGAYALLVVGLGDLARSLTGSGDLAVAASTLVVAALFRPLLRRVRARVDHRFNRARYDAARTIDAFTTRLRQEVDLDALGAELRDVALRTMHPSSLSLWLTPRTGR